MQETVDLTRIATLATSQSPTMNSGHLIELSTSQNVYATPLDGENEEAQLSDEIDVGNPRHKGIGGLRISRLNAIQEDVSEHQRRMVSDNRSFPKRRKITSDNFVFQPSTLDKLVIGIWEQVHGTLDLDPRAVSEQFRTVASEDPDALRIGLGALATNNITTSAPIDNDAFSRMNVFCRKVTQASRVCRSIEIIVQARWTESFQEQVDFRLTAAPGLSLTKHRKAVFMEACRDFGWSEKELRNKMAIWKG
jgi:ATP-dependent RNA helicase DDX49/DBP8